MIAAAPLSSIRFIVFRFLDKGEDDGTIGFFSCRPKYVVVKSIIFLLLGFTLAVFAPAGHLRVTFPSRIHICLG